MRSGIQHIFSSTYAALVPLIIGFMLSVGPGLELHLNSPPRLHSIVLLSIAALSLIPFFIHQRYQASIWLVLVGGFARLIETIGLQTCFPYGCFSYLQGIGTTDHWAPWTVIFAWPPLVLGAYVLVSHIPQYIGRILAGTLILLIFDMTFDPGAVHSGFWEYAAGGRYYAVPLSNFLGWILSGSIGMVLSDRILHYTRNHKGSDAMGGPRPMYVRSLLCMFAFRTGYAFWTSLRIPGILGATTLLIFLIVARNRAKQKTTKISLHA